MTRVVSILFAVWCVLSAIPAGARAEPRHVLLLYSYEREFSHFTFARLFRPELARSSPEEIDFIEVSLQTVRRSRTETDAQTLDGLRSTLGGRALDLVVTLGGPAAGFAQKHKTELFPDTPVLAAAVDSRFLQAGPLPPGMTAVTVKNDPLLMLESMLRVMPEVRTVVVVIGASRVEQFWVEEVRRLFRPFESRVSFIWTNDLSSADLIKRCASLPARSAIFYGIWSLDANGVPQIEDQTLDALHAAASAPMFGLHSHQLGHGIVGGPLLSMDDVSHDTAAVALRLLRHEPPEGIQPRTLLAGAPIFDGRELRRWGIAENRLAPGSQVLFREPTMWQRDRGLIMVAISVTGAQALLVVALAFNIARRRRVAPAGVADLRPAEAALSALSHRLMQAREEERAHIARTIHDDVCQQLTELTLRLHALGARPDAGDGELRSRVEELCTRFWTLEREILAISDPVYFRLELLGLAESARALCERRCEERGVTLDFQAKGVPAGVHESVALALFRVMEEAVENALTHAGARRLSVALTGSRHTIALDVVDEGRGFNVEAAIAAGAVGLIGIRERVRLVNGTCGIDSRPGGGTRIHVEVPLPQS